MGYKLDFNHLQELENQIANLQERLEKTIEQLELCKDLRLDVYDLKQRLEAWRAWYIDPDQDRTRLQDLWEI